MRFLNIPESIQASIFTKVLVDIDETYLTWKTSLQILAVCSLWRTICKPLVYKTAFVECMNALQGGDTKSSNQPASEITKIVSNIHLLCLVGAHDLPTHIRIITKTNENVVDLVETCADVVKYSNVRLANAKKITIDLNVWKYLERASVYMFSEQRRIASNAIDSLIQACPNINAIESNGVSSSSMVNYITSELSRKCSDRLVRIRSNAMLPVVDLSCCVNITHLDICICSLVLPYISTLPVEKLRHLCLTISIPYFPWELLIKKKQINIVIFPWLAYLRVRYESSHLNIDAKMRIKSMQAMDDPSTAKIQCPKLKRLEMLCCGQDYVLQSSLQSFPDIETLHIEESVAGLLYLRSIGLLSLRRIDICTTSSAGCNITSRDGVLVLNNFLKNTPLPPKVGLRVGFEIVFDTPDNFRWDVVTELRISSFIESDIMLKLLRSMPNLTKYVANIEVPDEDMYTKHLLNSQANQGQPTVQHMLSASLAHLQIYTKMIINNARYELEFAFAKYLIVGLPSLLQLKWPNIDFSDLFAFVKQSQQQHPHLRRLKIL